MPHSQATVLFPPPANFPVRFLRFGKNAAKIIICCTFGLFVTGFDKYIKAHDEGIFDYMVTTNLTYRAPIVLEQPWYFEADLSGYVGKIINTMNHNIAVSTVVSPIGLLQDLVKQYEC